MEKNKNWFVRILIIALSVLIGAMVLVSFLLSEPRYTYAALDCDSCNIDRRNFDIVGVI